jgi:hypothetical protein
MKKLLFLLAVTISSNIVLGGVLVRGNYVYKTTSGGMTYGYCNSEPVENCETTWGVSSTDPKITVFTYRKLDVDIGTTIVINNFVELPAPEATAQSALNEIESDSPNIISISNF